MSDKTRAAAKHTLANLKLLIIDEMSLVGADMLYRIHKRLCTILEMNENTDPFANINVMLVGDLLQIPPPMGHQVYAKPIEKEMVSFYDGLGDEVLWSKFQPMILKHNHRQGESKVWADALNEIRVGIATQSTEAMLRTRLTKEEHLDEKALHLFYFNKDVTDHNGKMLKKLPGELISVKAVISMPRGTKKPDLDSGKKTIANTEFKDVFEFKIGARVMMIHNKDLTDDLFNGAGGTIVGIEYSDKHQAKCVIIQFDLPTCGEKQRAKYPGLSAKYKRFNGTPIFRHEHEFNIKTKSYGKKYFQAAKGKLLQFPLRLYYASTAHKIQVNLRVIPNFLQYI